MLDLIKREPFILVYKYFTFIVRKCTVMDFFEGEDCCLSVFQVQKLAVNGRDNGSYIKDDRITGCHYIHVTVILLRTEFFVQVTCFTYDYIQIYM